MQIESATALAALAAQLPQAQAVTSLEEAVVLAANNAFMFVHDGVLMAIPWEILLVILRFVFQLIGIPFPF